MENLDVTLTRPIDGNFVKFYHRRVPDKLATKKAGRDKFTYKPYVKIKSPGQEKQVIDKEVTENVLFEWQYKYPQPASGDYMKAWQDFIAAEAPRVDGSPLDQWGEISRDRVDALVQHGITTIENLAAAPDAVCGIGIGKVVTYELRDKAREFLKGDTEREVRARLLEKDKQLTDVTAELEESREAQVLLAERLAKLEKALESSNDMSGRTARDGDNGSVGDSGVSGPDSGSGSGARKTKSKRGRKA